MAWLKRTFTNWWVVSILTAVLIALALILLLPLVVGLMRPLLFRLSMLLLVIVGWGGVFLWRILSARAAARRLAAGLAEPGEAGVLQGRLAEALAMLKTAQGGKRDYLYSRPWYVIIGPPAAGKTTALVNSGLRFPFSDTVLKGAGGTRNLDFWFADEAVLVDTAGRYTSQDSDADRDAEGWRGFLRLLKRNRPLRPINGVLVALGVDALLGGNVRSIDDHAVNIRKRITELTGTLEISVPVYVLLTKADLIAGFSEFFADLDVEGRRAVLGSTFDLDAPPADASAATRAFDGVVEALRNRTPSRLQDELDLRRRSLIVAFPSQLDELRARLIRLLDGAFPSEGVQSNAAELRGFYLTSAIQEGAPIDRLLNGLASVYETSRSEGRGRAFFLNRMLTEVLIPEAGLVRTAASALTRRFARLSGAFALIGAVALIVITAWTVSFFANRGFQGDLAHHSLEAQQMLKDSGADLTQVRATDATLEDVLPALNALRNLPRGYAARRRGGAPLHMRFGLFESGESRRAETTYLETLRRVLLPRLILRAEQTLQAPDATALSSYEPLKAYMTLGGQAPSFDAGAVRAWVISDWETSVLPGADRAETRRQLAEHLDALLADSDLGQVWQGGRAPLDGALINTVQLRLKDMPAGDRAYAILKQGAMGQGKDWSAKDQLAELGSGAANAFANPGQVASLGVPFLFTKEGYQTTYQLGLRTIDAQIRKDAWLFGEDANRSMLATELRTIRPVIAGHYADEYIQNWDRVAAALTPAAYFSDPQAKAALFSAVSPIKTMFTEVRTNTNLGPVAADHLEKAALARLAGSTPAAKLLPAVSGDAAPDAGALVAGHFKDLNTYTAGGLDDFLSKLKAAIKANDVQHALAGTSGGDTASVTTATAQNDLQNAALGVPPAAQAFPNAATKQAGAAQTTAQQGQLTGAYEKELAPRCQMLVNNHYPFTSRAQDDAAQADVKQMFGRGGGFDTLIQGRLAPLLDTTGPSWHWTTSEPLAAGLAPTSAEEMQRATQIRDLLENGVQGLVELISMTGATHAELMTGPSQALAFNSGQTGAQPFQWTYPPFQEARLNLSDDGKEVHVFDASGPWALFRLMSQGAMQNSGPSFIITFGDTQASVKLKVRLKSDINPFKPTGMWSFRCPGHL